VRRPRSAPPTAWREWTSGQGRLAPRPLHSAAVAYQLAGTGFTVHVKSFTGSDAIAR
jgi:hypothetical protein